MLKGGLRGLWQELLGYEVYTFFSLGESEPFGSDSDTYVAVDLEMGPQRYKLVGVEAAVRSGVVVSEELFLPAECSSRSSADTDDTVLNRAEPANLLRKHAHASYMDEPNLRHLWEVCGSTQRGFSCLWLPPPATPTSVRWGVPHCAP